MENTEESKRDKIKADFSKNFKTVLTEKEQDMKNDILSFVDMLSDEEVHTISQLEKLRKGEISSSDLDMSKLNEIRSKLNVGMMNIVKKYKTF
jgi:replication initiation and membrane attachment protein DnaB